MSVFVWTQICKAEPIFSSIFVVTFSNDQIANRILQILHVGAHYLASSKAQLTEFILHIRRLNIKVMKRLSDKFQKAYWLPLQMAQKAASLNIILNVNLVSIRKLFFSSGIHFAFEKSCNYYYLNLLIYSSKQFLKFCCLNLFLSHRGWANQIL